MTSGRLDLTNLPADDEEAIAALIRVKGIGRWSAEIYLLFAEGRSDVWPAGDLAVQIEIGRILGHDDRPSEKADPRTGRSLAPAPRRRGDPGVAPLQGRYGGDLIRLAPPPSGAGAEGGGGCLADRIARDGPTAPR